MESEDALDEAYWQRQMRESVAFDRCVEALAELGVQVVVEIGPDAVLGPIDSLGRPESADDSRVPIVLSSLRAEVRRRDDGFVAAVAGAYEAGLAVSFAGLFAGEARCRISLPSYPFQRRRHWIETRSPLFEYSGLTQCASSCYFARSFKPSTIAKGLRTWPQQ